MNSHMFCVNAASFIFNLFIHICLKYLIWFNKWKETFNHNTKYCNCLNTYFAKQILAAWKQALYNFNSTTGDKNGFPAYTIQEIFSENHKL